MKKLFALLLITVFVSSSLVKLYKDFTNGKLYGKYAGSAYLLLNSLPYKNLEDTIIFNERMTSVRISDMFKEVASTHYVPYHLMLKWGSLF